jgi:uncharacterized protein (TIGR02678 family)
VLSRVAGEEDAFVRAAGDALYDIERRVLAALISSPRGASTVDADDFESRLEQLGAEPVPVAEDLRVRSIRQRVTRRMLDDPVLYYDELDETELAYLTSQRSAMIRRLEERTGLLAEVRAEGLAMVDPNDELTDVRMPEVGTDGHVALLITEHLSGRLTNGAAPCTESELHVLVRRLADEHRGYWRHGTREPGAEVALVTKALDRLEALRLIRREPDGVHPLPAIARFGLAAPTLSDALTVEEACD